MGWFSDPGGVPAYDPMYSKDVNYCLCLVCEEPIGKGSVKTTNIMHLESKKSYYYRCHPECLVKFGGKAADEKAFGLIEKFNLEASVSA